MDRSNKDGEILDIKISQFGTSFKMYSGLCEYSYIIGPNSISYKALADDNDVETWQRINIRRIHKQLFEELVDRFKILKRYCTQRVNSKTKFMISIRYKLNVDCYNYEGDFRDFDPLFVKILNRIVYLNKMNTPIYKSEPITDEFINNLKPENIKLLYMIKFDKYLRNDEMYILDSNDVMHFTKFIDLHINSEEKTYKIFPNLNNDPLKPLSRFEIKGVTFTILKPRYDSYIFLNDNLNELFFRLIDDDEYRFNKKFNDFLLKGTNVPTKVILKREIL